MTMAATQDEPLMPVPAARPVVAVFDFDNTLVKGDSLWPFLVAVAGWPRALVALAVARSRCLVRRPADAPTSIKGQMLWMVLTGQREAGLGRAVAKLRRWPRWIDANLAILKEHYAAGHHVVIASGGLDLYLPVLLEKIPHHALVCTRMESVGGVLTGRMESGNCVRARKAELVAAYLGTLGPSGESWAYGNYPHDLPMMQLAQYRVIV
jgi:HAD superfamily phosphoserine phosphatase-like hydrolase